ncbi:alginate export family protein [Bosea sp. 685]|uniref:alginate export family protein n=1 Tax=Bosea sp. 685 TaxID=3080057 RepID=UPI0028930EA0|nr:alginate export family protein [Bosea sp. 685]WNJ88490.1 alginate export family protein [Bosea sp. 685]
MSAAKRVSWSAFQRGRRLRRLAGPALLALLGLGVTAAPAQTSPGRPPYESLRFNEDWSPLHDPSLRTDPFDPLKWIPLNGAGSVYLTLGGELRARYEAARAPVFGLSAPRRNDYTLLRSFLFADLHLGPHARAFLELASGFAPGWAGTPPPTQKDELDILQAFGEVTLPTAGGQIMLRGGRQEMSFGSSRLVSVRESPNIRRAFDGVRAAWIGAGDTRIDAFLVRPVSPQLGSFNDSNDRTQLFWGAYATTAIPALPGLKADLYYLGLERDEARFAQGVANEHRHTLGTRLFGKRGGFDWNVEAAYQFGSFGTAAIRAWTVSAALGYSFADLPFSPRLGLNADAISGDGNPRDNRLGTFNPLFPKLPYFSEANLAAPANLLDLQPNLTLSLTPKLNLTLGWNPLWKQAEADAFYAPPLSPVRGSAGGTGRFIGQQTSLALTWSATEHLTIGGTYVHYTPGERLKQAGAGSGEFLAGWAQVIF